MHVIRSPEGEIQVVESLDGYQLRDADHPDGWEALGTCRKAPPDDHRWDHAKGKFVACAKLAADREKAQRATPQAVLQRMAELEARVEALEKAAANR